MKKKIAMIFPYAPVYREGVYRAMDKSFDVDWYFAGNASRDLKLLDYSKLRNCNLSLREKKLFGPITRLEGVKNIPFDKYDAVIIPGVIRCISDWKLIRKLGGRKDGPQLLLWTHGWYGRETELQKKIKKIFFHKTDGIFLYGDYARNLMLKEGFDPMKLHVIKNSLDYEKQLPLRNPKKHPNIYSNHFKNTNRNIIFIGRLTPSKKLDILIGALSILKNNGEHYNLTLIGDGSDRMHLENVAKAKGLADRIWFYGECFDEEKNADNVSNADLCVSPGNIGLSAIHCLMFGCPVITHNNFKYQGPEIEAIKDDITGTFFEQDNLQSLASAISNWFGKNHDRESVRKASYAEVDHFWNPEYQIRVLKKVLDEA